MRNLLSRGSADFGLLLNALELTESTLHAQTRNWPFKSEYPQYLPRSVYELGKVCSAMFWPILDRLGERKPAKGDSAFLSSGTSGMQRL